MKNILLTIAIPTYKRPKYLAQAIDSAVQQKNVDLNYEIIVVNNDPETDLKDIESRYQNSDVPVTFYVNERNLGMIGNVNRCIELANGEYIAYLHDDDILLPNYVEKIGKILKDGMYSCLIPKRYLFFEGNGAKGLEERKQKKEFIKKLFFNTKNNARELIKLSIEDNVYCWMNCYCAPSCGVVFNKQAINEAGLFFPEGTLAWDFISFVELNKYKEIYIVNETLSAYRIAVGLTQKAETQYDFYKAFDDFLTYCDKNCVGEEFIERYYDEIKYLNYSMLSDDGAALVEQRYKDVVKTITSKMKFYWFMYKRLRYLYAHGLDVEMVLDEKGVATMKNMGVIGD